MVGLFGYILAGAAEGTGNSIVDQAKAKRAAALEEMRTQREMEFRRGEREAGQSFQREEREARQKFDSENTQGEMVDLGGGRYGVRRGTTVQPLRTSDGQEVVVPSSREAPKVEKFYDQQGNEYMAQWNAQSGQWEQVGGAKPSGDGIVVTSPDGTTMRIGGKGANLTEGQSKDAVYSTRAQGALEILDEYDAELTSVTQRAMDRDPTGIIRGRQSEDFQKAKQAGDEFLQAILRKDTGAAITEQEQTLYGQTYLPQPGDGEDVLAQKRLSRRRALEAMKAGMPPQAILKQEQALANTGDTTRPAGAVDAKTGSVKAPAIGTIEDGFRFLGGDPSDQNSWEEVR